MEKKKNKGEEGVQEYGIIITPPPLSLDNTILVFLYCWELELHSTLFCLLAKED